MLPPGFLSIIADIAGIIFISLGGIPVLKEIGLAGAVWLAGSLTMVFVFQPIFMSYLPRPRIKPRSWAERGLWAGGSRLGGMIEALVRVPVTPGALRTAILICGAAFIVWAWPRASAPRSATRRPARRCTRPGSKVKRDMAEIGKYLPLDEGWIVLETPDWPIASRRWGRRYCGWRTILRFTCRRADRPRRWFRSRTA